MSNVSTDHLSCLNPASRESRSLGARSRLLASLVLSAFLQGVAPSPATTQSNFLTVQVSGSVVLVDDLFCQCLMGVDIGSPVTGYYVYDLAGLDAEPDPSVGLYEYQSLPNEIVLMVGDHEFRSDPASPEFSVSVHDSVVDGGGAHDLLRVLEWNPYDARHSHIDPHFVHMELRDTCSAAIESDALPTAPPVLWAWPQKKLEIVGSSFWILATLDSIAVNVGAERVPELKQPEVRCFPNPTSGGATIVVQFPEASIATADVWSVNGRRVNVLGNNRSFPAGMTTLRWDGTDARGQAMPSGVYFVRVTTGKTSAASRLVFVR